MGAERSSLRSASTDVSWKFGGLFFFHFGVLYVPIFRLATCSGTEILEINCPCLALRDTTVEVVTFLSELSFPFEALSILIGRFSGTYLVYGLTYVRSYEFRSVLKFSNCSRSLDLPSDFEHSLPELHRFS